MYRLVAKLVQLVFVRRFQTKPDTIGLSVQHWIRKRTSVTGHFAVGER